MNAIREALAGEAIADTALAKIRGGCSDPDLLLRVLTGILADQGHLVVPGDVMRSAVRRVQKALEQGAGHG